MARGKKKAAGAPEAAKPEILPTKVLVQLHPDTPIYYINHAEVGFTAHEFTVMAVRVPVKLAPEVLATVQRDRTLTLDADIQLVVPPTLMPGLIRALTLAKDQYEKSTGITVTDVSTQS